MQPETGDPVPQDLGTLFISGPSAQAFGVAFLEDHVGGWTSGCMRGFREGRPSQNLTLLLFYLRVLFGSWLTAFGNSGNISCVISPNTRQHY